MKELIDAGACVEGIGAGSTTPLHNACLGHKLWSRTLLSHADLNARCGDGMTAMFIAAAGGAHKVICTLLNEGADVDKATDDGETPLMAACANGHARAVSVLLTDGHADVSVERRDGATALTLACCERRLGIVHFLKVLANVCEYLPTLSLLLALFPS